MFSAMISWESLVWIILAGIITTVAYGQEFGPSINDVVLPLDSDAVLSRSFSDDLSLVDEVVHTHKLVKRQTPTNPINMTFQLEKLGTWASDSNIKIGHKIPFKLTIWFDETGSTDLNVEVITPTVRDANTNTEWAALSVCTPQISSVGTNFGGFASAEIFPIMSSAAGDGRYDRATIDFETVVGTNIGTDRNNDKLEMLFDIIVNNHPALVDGTTVYASVGAQFNNKQNVWISQAVFTVVGTTYEARSSDILPEFLLSGPDILMKGSTGVWTLDMILRDASNDILVEVYAPNEGAQVMSVCRISVGNTGDSYNCYSREEGAELSFPDVPDETPINGTHTVALFDMRTVINTNYWDGASTSADNNISLSIAVMMLNVSDVVPFVTYNLGVAVEVDKSLIWAAEIQVEARDTWSDSSGNLPTVLLWTQEDQLTWNSIMTMYVNITIAAGITDVYLLETSLNEDGNSNIFTVGNEPISAYYVGFNFPCWDSSIMTTTVEGGDYLKLDMGSISNSAERKSSSDNTIVIRIQAQVMDFPHPNVTDGDTVSLSVGLRIGANLIWIGSLDYVISDHMTAVAPDSPTMSIWNMMNHRDSGLLYEQGSTAYTIKLDIPPASFWPNFNVNVNSPMVGDSPAIDLCDIEVYQSGRDLVYGYESGDNPYGTLTEYERVRMPHTKTFVTHSYSLSLLNFGNAGYGKFWWLANDTALYLTLTLRATDNPLLVNESFYWVNVTVDYDSRSTPLSEDVALQYATNQPELSEEDMEPSYTIVQTSSSNAIRASGVALFDVNILTTPRTIQDLSVEAFTLNDSISVCRMGVRQKGKKIPCVRGEESYYTYYGEAENVTCSIDSTDTKCLDSQQDHGIYSMGKVPNMGQEPITNNTRAESELSVQVAVQIHPYFADSISNGDAFTLILGIFQGGNTLLIDEVKVEADTSAMPPMVTLPELRWYLRNNVSEITRGGATVFVLDVYIPPASMAAYRLEFFSPINSTQNGGKASISDARVMSANWHLPCVNDSYVTHERLSLDNGTTYDVAVVDLGVVTNTAPDDGSYLLNATENMMRVEVVMCVPSDSEAVPGDYLWLAATLKINEDNIWVASLPIEVTLDVSPNDSVNDTELTMQMNASDSYIVGIGQPKRFSVDIQTQIGMSHLTFNFLFPHDSAGETLLTLALAHVSFAGTNIVSGYSFEPNVTISNTITSPSTSQDEDLEVDLGIVTNVGTTTRYDFGDYLSTDDMITMSFDIIPADNAQNTHGSQKDFDVIMTDSEGRTDTVSGYVVIHRDGMETPDLQIADISIPESVGPTDISQGDIVTVYVHFNHTSLSSAHAHNVVVRFYVPDLLTYVTYGDFKYIVPITDMSAKRVFSSSITELFFSDNETFHVNFTFDPTHILPVGAGLVHLVVPCDITYESEGATPYLTDMSLLEFDVFVPDCFEPLGLESGSLQDCQIVSSVVDGFDPDLVRLNSLGGWLVPGVRGPPFLQNDYLQINFGRMTRITGFKIQPYFNETNFVAMLRLQYSYEALKWFDYMDTQTNSPNVFDMTFEEPNLATVSEVLIELNSTYEHPIEARYLRVLPWSSLNGSSQLSMRLELYGCALTDPTPQVACPVDNRNAVYERGYLLDENEGTLYVCMLSNIDDYIKCSYTEDEGDSWEEMTNDVININFMRRDTNTLYGLARNRLSRVRSDDGGENWWTVTEVEYTEAGADLANVINVKSLPFDNWPLNLEDLHQEFGLYFNLTIKWTADMDGLHVWHSTSGNWVMVGYWFDQSLN